ncbi:glycine-rich domain-containing protein [Streptomyces sp. NPDC002659]|uniref:glycine-rich domain-containing protein n=1 Tax=Streptomyces sp. NPDC002659 TaxID=3364656 RepID=UPI00368A5149
MTVELTRPAGTIDPATLVDTEVMERLIACVVKDYPHLDRVTARRVVAQTAAFIATSAHRPGVELSPSKLVDIGWHTWILHTVDYARFCEQVCGRFIHHVPTPNGEEPDLSPAAARERTLAAMTQAGFTIDLELWPVTDKMGECSQCHAGCTDSPNGGKK